MLSDKKDLPLLINSNGFKHGCMRHCLSLKTPSIGVYPEIAFKDAKSQRDCARKQLQQDVDSSADKQVQKIFKVVSRDNSIDLIV